VVVELAVVETGITAAADVVSVRVVAAVFSGNVVVLVTVVEVRAGAVDVVTVEDTVGAAVVVKAGAAFFIP
jgi:lipopolysaccharide export system protein LptA